MLNTNLSNVSDNLGNISSHNVERVIGKTSTTLGGYVTLEYPNGFDVNNCIIMGFKLWNGSQYVSNGFENRLQLNLTSNGIYVYTNTIV